MASQMNYLEATQLLQSYGVELPPFRLVRSAEAAVQAADALGYPVAVKAISAEMSHKSDRGLVKLGLNSADAVHTASRTLLTAVDWTTDATLEGLLVQKMASTGVEVIVGLQHDAQFGPIIALGAGGILVELLDDVVLRMPPISHAQAGQMLSESKTQCLLAGYRNHPPSDQLALQQLLVNLSALALDANNRIASIDLNPVIVHPIGQGISIVDVRIALF